GSACHKGQPSGEEEGPSAEAGSFSDLELVPPDAAGFVTVRLAEVGQSRLGQQARRELAETSPATLRGMENMVGVSWKDLESITAVLLNTSPGDDFPSVLFLTRNPYDRAKVRNTIVPEGVAKKYKNRTFYAD